MCVFGIVALCGVEVGAVKIPHAHRHQHIVRLQEAVDRLAIRQRTDHILITNLQKAVMEAQERDVWHKKAAKGEEEEEGSVLSRLMERMEEVRGSVNMVLEDQHRRDEILELRQELALLRSEVKHLKESREAENKRHAAHTHTQQQREAVTATWVVDNVQRLQEAVVDLQQAYNVTTAMHDKQEVESRLVVVSRDLVALRGSLAAVTSKAEAAVAMVTALQEELTRTSQDSHRSAGKVAALETEVTDIREDFNNLLAALPEGTMVAAAGTQGLKDKAMAGTGQHVVSGTEAERQLETRVRAVETGVGEVQASSVQLLATLEALEARVEKDVAEVRQEVAKLEYKATATQEDGKT